MKKSLLLGIVSLAAGAATSFGQGFIWLDNYDSTAHPLITYGPGSGGTVGTGILAGFTVGMYFGAGALTLPSDPSGFADPSILNPSFGLASGGGSTAPSYTSAFSTPGQYAASADFQPGLGAGALISVVVVAYNGANYDASTIRGHSAAFEITTSVGTAFPTYTGDAAGVSGGFSPVPVPEPTTLALAGLGGLSLLLLRRKQS